MAAMVKSEPLESDIYPETKHCHSFSFSFPTHKITKEEITCTKPGTILRALETNDTFKGLNQMDKKTLKGKDIVIKSCKGYIVKHFPCWLIEEDDLLTIEMVTHATDETAGVTDEETDNYVTFSVETRAGKNSKTKQILRNIQLQSYGPLCVYAKQKQEVKQALRNDGRFSNIVFEQKCQLSERSTGSKVSMGQIAKKLNGRNFEICLTKLKETATKMGTSDSIIKTKTFVNSEGDTAQTSLFDPSPDSEGDGTQTSPSTLTTKTSDVGESSSRRKQKRKCNPMPEHGEILKILRNQFDDLVKQIESRREDRQKKTFPEELDLMKQEFGKIRQKFSEVHRVKKLIELGASVCQVIVDGVQGVQGTGFVLFDNFVLTNAHLFGDNVRRNMQLLVDVSVKFNYENPNGSDVNVFKAKTLLIDFQYEDKGKHYIDYAILEMDPQNKKQQKKVPPGLLREYGPVPACGGACLIGHPGGLVKQMEPTSIIGSEIREEAANKYKRENGHAIFTINERYEEVMQENKDDFVTYNTSFFHGSSGSPVFDDLGRVFGMHTGGFEYEDKRTQSKQSVLEYALPLLTTLQNFVIRLKEDNKQDVLTRVQDEAQKNLFLFEALFKTDEPMDMS
ncbi:serine protease FAM111A-like [Salvelinus fontinalis]|uniref:serine protease FAM111A-like n=1 Tax=Salvelinus fontinalis TaxID=8038 RepID=UPI0024866CBF|nr:serine protease FAM111A-like [Salvelinus fontinalis]